MVRSVLSLPEEKLKEVFRTLTGPGAGSRTFTTLERTILTEFVLVMEPFEEATNCVQGEGRVTVSSVIPGIRGLRHKLTSCKSTYCKPLITELQTALNTRLSKCESHPLYITGAVLDPRFKLQWCRQDELENVRSTVVSEIQLYAAIFAASAGSQTLESTSSSTASESVSTLQTSQEPPAKKAKLFSFMDSHSKTTQSDHDDALDMHQELMDYFKTKLLDYDSDPMIWWRSHASEFPKLARMAQTVLSIPASSAPGKIFRPERTKLSADKFESLVFKKCNKGLY